MVCCPVSRVGVLIPETGGLRKLRWTAKGKGKRGGSRVIYYFHNLDVPVFLMAIFATTSRPICRRDSVALARQLRCALKSDWKRKGPNESSRPTESAEGISLWGSASCCAAPSRRAIGSAGKPTRVRVTHVVPSARSRYVRRLRRRMKLSQTQFAAKFGFSLDSIQNWEQGHRRPEGPARILLVVIAGKNPKAVEEALIA